MLKVSNLSLTRDGKLLFENLSFSVKGSEVLQISGKNGSGKSSLAFILAGDLKPNSGEIEVIGRLGFLMQNLEIDFAIAVRDFVEMGRPGASIDSIAKSLQIEYLLDKKITQISMGQLQRVQIAQLLLQDSEIYILDEPFSAQDQESTKLLINMFKGLKLEGKTLILINHADFDLEGLVDKTINLGS